MARRPHVAINFNFSADSAKGYLIKAAELRRNRRYDDAADVIRQGLEDFPQNAALWNELGKRFQAKWRDDDALAAFATAYRLDPQDAFIAMNYAGFLTKKSQFDLAEQVFMKQYQREGQDVRLLTALGNMYQAKGVNELAAACFGRAVEIRPNDDIAMRRHMEMSKEHGVAYTNEAWDKFAKRAKSIIAKFDDAPKNKK